MTLNKFNISFILTLTPREFKKYFKFLGEGIARKVYAINDFVVAKVAKGEDGILQNFVEYYIYTHSENRIKKYLCPVLYYSKNILLMLRATPYFNISRKSLVDLSALRDESTVEEDILSLGNNYHLFIPDLYAPTSWGYINNNYYLIDYGCTSDIGDGIYDVLMQNNNI